MQLQLRRKYKYPNPISETDYFSKGRGSKDLLWIVTEDFLPEVTICWNHIKMQNIIDIPRNLSTGIPFEHRRILKLSELS